MNALLHLMNNVDVWLPTKRNHEKIMRQKVNFSA